MIISSPCQLCNHHSQLPELDERMDESRATEVVVVIVAAEHQRHDELSRVKLDYALDPLSIKTATTPLLLLLLLVYVPSRLSKSLLLLGSSAAF